MPGYDDNTVSAKSVAMCVLFTASMGLGMVPVWLSRVFKWNSDTKNHQYVQILLCLSGGVLLCTTFLHLLPEVTEKIDDLEYISKYELHYAELLMCAGFFVMYLVEECVHAYMHHRQKTKSAISKTLSIRRGDSLTPEGSSTNIQQPISVCADDTHLHQGHSHLMAEDEDAAIQTLRGLLVVLALSIHELFEGLAVGLETSSKNVWYMFGAVSAHKLIIAFCIGVELVTSKMTTCLVVIYIFTFSVVTPLGIAIGILLTRNGEAPKNLFPIILQGLSSGTLLYVVFFEILSTERKSGLKQFSAVLAGFMLMFCLAFLE